MLTWISEMNDYVWQFIVAVIAVLATIGWELVKRRLWGKSLSYGIDAVEELLVVGNEIADDLRIEYQGSAIADCQLILISIRNDGGESILATDFVQPLTLAFGGDSRVLRAEVTKVQPPALNVVVHIVDQQVRIEPLLMNGGDLFQLRILLSGFHLEDLSVQCRVVGIHEVSQFNARSELRKQRLAFGQDLAAFLAVYSVVIVFFYPGYSSQSEHVRGLLDAYVFFVWIGSTVFLFQRVLRSYRVLSKRRS